MRIPTRVQIWSLLEDSAAELGVSRGPWKGAARCRRCSWPPSASAVLSRSDSSVTAALPGDRQNKVPFHLNLVAFLEILVGESPSFSHRGYKRMLWLILSLLTGPAPKVIWKEPISAFSSVSGHKTNNSKKHLVIYFFFPLTLCPSENLKMQHLTFPT